MDAQLHDHFSFLTRKKMLSIVVLLSLIISITTAQNITSRAFNPCVTNFDCVHGICDTNKTIASCVCVYGWTLSLDGSNQCNYQQKSKLAAFLLSFLIGALGADWFYLSVGNSGYIVAGVFKLLTLGGLGIWWLVDWIRILTNGFSDGNGIGLLEWTP
jgi:TM2 domain-containing membrane protein YozV